MTHHINNTRDTVVADSFYYQPMATCPLGVKVILLGQGGVATIGNYNGKEAFWQGWAPLPKRRRSHKPDSDPPITHKEYV